MAVTAFDPPLPCM